MSNYSIKFHKILNNPVNRQTDRQTDRHGWKQNVLGGVTKTRLKLNRTVLLLSVVCRCWFGGRSSIRPVKDGCWTVGMCWWWWFDWSQVQMICTCFRVPAITTSTSIICSCSKTQNGLAFWYQLLRLSVERLVLACRRSGLSPFWPRSA